MAKQNNTIFWIIGIAIVIFLILPQLQAPTEEGMIGLIPHYYKDGVEVFPKFSLLRFSVVTPPGGTYDQISFDISAINQDVPIENIQIIGASPQVFKDALPTTTQTLASEEIKTLWTSNLMDTEQFEAISPVNFWIEVSGIETYTDTTIFPDRAYSGDISFEAYILHSTYNCYSGDVYWYDNLGIINDKKEECGTSAYTGSNYCYNNDVYRDYVTRGCSGLSCTQSTSKIKQEDCGTLGCSGGICNPEPTIVQCYQETANVATTCGGLDSGVYSWDGDWKYGSPENVYDGDWNTKSWAFYPPSESNYYVNYTIPYNLESAIFKTKDPGGIEYVQEIVIPDSCLVGNVLALRAKIIKYPSPPTTQYFCLTSTNWQQIGSDRITDAIYEEAMWWRMGGASSP